LITLEPILRHVPVWALVFFRLAGIFLVAPLFASQTIPRRVKILLALGLSFCVYPMLMDVESGTVPAASGVVERARSVLTEGLHFWALAPIVTSEIMIGLVIGFGATLPIFGIQLGARMIDQQMGLTAEVFNPELGEGAGVLDQVYFVLAMLIFLGIGGHRVLIEVLVGTFTRVPLGGFTADPAVMSLLTGLLASMMELAFRVAGPLLCLVFLESVAMGFIARTVPQMNILSIGFPVRIIAGASLLLGAAHIDGAVFENALTENLSRIGGFFGL